MRNLRFSIGGLMSVVLVMALGLAALRNPLAIWAGFVPLATRGLICIAVVGAVCRNGTERAWWVGFAVCAWTYLNYFSFLNLSSRNPINVMLQTLGPMIGVPMTNPGRGEFGLDELQRSFLGIAHSLCALMFALVGAFLGWALFCAKSGGLEQGRIAEQPAHQSQTKSWVIPSAILLTGVVLIVTLCLACARLAPGLWAGTAFLLTWWLIGLTSLGALFGRGRRREFWLGASLFGAGFLLLVFSEHPSSEYEPRSFLPTFRFLESLRPQLGNILMRVYGDTGSASARDAQITAALERRVPMHFADPTPLEEVLAYIRNATRRADGNEIPIYVNPLELKEAERTLESQIENIEFENVELRTSLRLLLKQLDLDYVVKDGLLQIISAESMEFRWIAIEEDGYQTFGHCFLALIATVLGGFAAPLVCDLARRSPG